MNTPKDEQAPQLSTEEAASLLRRIYNDMMHLKLTIDRIVEDRQGNAWLTMDAAAEYTNLSVSTIQRAVAKGDLMCSKTTGRNLFRKQWLDHYLTS